MTTYILFVAAIFVHLVHLGHLGHPGSGKRPKSPRVAPSPPRVPSCALISAGLLSLVGFWWSHVMNCPCSSQSSGRYFTSIISEWARNCCRLSKAGLQGQVCRDIYVAENFAPIGPWVMSSTAFSIPCVSMATSWVLHCSLMRRRRKFTTSIQPAMVAMAYEDESVMPVWASLTMANTRTQTYFWSLCHMRDLMAS